MKNIIKTSFRKRLTVSFLCVSLVPLILCSALLYEAFKVRLGDNSDREAGEQLDGVSRTLSFVEKQFRQTSDTLSEGKALIRELNREDKKDTLVYKELFALTNKMRSFARFDIFDESGKWLYSTESYIRAKDMPTDWGILNAASKSPDGIAFMALGNYNKENQPLIQGACAVRDRDGDVENYFLMSINDKGLNTLFDGKHYRGSELIILSKYWRPVYSSFNDIDEVTLMNARSHVLQGNFQDLEDENFSYTIRYSEPMKLYLVLKHSNSFMYSTLRLLMTVTVTTALLCVAVSVFISVKLSRQMSKPIEELHKAFEEVGNNNLDVKADSLYDDELGQLVYKFNGMVGALKKNQEQMVENQKELNEAQIRMLQAQLNPHFLCNTLDTIKWISKINKVPQIALMSTNLADILRFAISSLEFVTLETEIIVLERYIEIQKIRLSDDFSLKVDIPDELYSAVVPKMMLQPIVENAVMHGLEGVEQGEIKVSARKTDDGVLNIIVEDNGRGFPQDMLGFYSHRDNDKKRGHLGLYNVDTILLKYYGEGFGLYLENIDENRGARVLARLPLKFEEEENA